MGDISELRGLLVIVGFLASLVLLISLIPTGFFAYTFEGRTIIVEDYFEAIDLQSFVDTWTYTLNETGGELVFGFDVYEVPVETAGEWLGGHDISLFYRVANASNPEVLTLTHFWAEFIFGQQHDLEWKNFQGISRGTSLEGTELDADYSEETIDYTSLCSHFQVKVFFGFNETTYSSPTEAWNHHGLSILIGINFDQVSTGSDAWGIISMLLFFQMPEISVFLNAIIAIPLWIGILYITYILILRAIGAVFGGGGA